MGLRFLVGILLVVLVAVSSLGCATKYSSLAARFPNARLRGVCALPKPLGLDEHEWVYTASGRLVGANAGDFAQVASTARDIFVFDLDASKSSPSILPIPDNALECKTGFSWLDPAPVYDAPATGCRGTCNLPSSSAVYAEVQEHCPIHAPTEAVAGVEQTSSDPRLIAQTVPEVRSPMLQPLPGVAYPPNCETLVRNALKTQAHNDAYEYGKRVGNVIGSAMAGWNTFANSGNDRIRNEFANDPQVIATAQGYVARRLDEIPNPPEYADAELAGVAQAAFEEGYGESMAQVQRQFAAFEASCTLLIIASGPIAAVAETAAAKGLRVALARVRAMPIFLPSAVGGGAFLKRLPKALPSATAAGTTYVAPRPPALAPGARPPPPPPPAAKPSPGTTTATNAGGAAATQAAPTGQLHHGISERIYRALEKHDKLKGAFKLRDPQYTARAATLEDHNGYQKWHEALDDEVVRYIEGHPDLDPKKFASWLYKRYMQPDLAKRFPAGLGANK